MSYPELKNWNPMEDSYRRSTKSNEKYNLSNDIDPLCLYVCKIPVSIGKDEFSAMMSRNRRVSSVMLNEKILPNREHTYGFVHFDSYEDALFAMNELNQKPPYYFQVSFAKKKKENIDKDNQSMKSISKGRGFRIDLEGNKSISHKLKVTTGGGDGRKVTVGSPEKPHYETQNTERYNATKPTATPAKSDSKRPDTVPLGPNPFHFCFICKKDGLLACANCKKPYCSKTCQLADWNGHKSSCREAKIAVDGLFNLYKLQSEALDSSYQSESSSSEFEKSQECYDVERLLVSPGLVEKVTVVNINSPSEFWVQLKMFSEDFCQMEKDLSSLQRKSSLKNISYKDNLHCCTVYNNKVYRAKVLKATSANDVSVSLFDYGKTVTVPKNSLYVLAKEFRKLPTQAVCCKLVDETKKERINWSSDDTVSFQLHTDDKVYKAHILKYFNYVADVSLINEDGIALFSILAEGKKSLPLSDSKSLGTATSVSEETISMNDGSPPSVWSKLKSGMKTLIVPVIVNENSIWCYLSADGGADLGEVIETQKLLQNYSGKDITVCAEEGDFAAGFSNEYKEYYRCRILKRKCGSFSVQYIDYGNEEEVTQLNALSDELLKMCSYTVRCDKPVSLPLEDFQKFLGEAGAEINIDNVKNDFAELSFNFQGKHIVRCYPCYPCFVEKELKTVNKKPQVSHAGSNDIDHVPKQNVVHKVPKANNVEAKNLQLNHMYSNIRIVYIKTASEMYVQFDEEEKKLNELVSSLNNYCNSMSSGHVPSVGEIVCCKFSEDGVWYRGQVKEKVDNRYRIFFIDYGNEDLVLTKDIQVLADNFMSSMFAVCISVSGIKDEDISPSILKKLLEESWDMKVISEKRNLPFEVILYQNNCPISSMIKGKNVSANKASQVNQDRIKPSVPEVKSPKDNAKGAYTLPEPKKENVELPHVSSLKKCQLNESVSTVKVCYVDDGVYYCHLESDNDQILNLFKALQNLHTQEKATSLFVGNVIAALSVDGFYYRASVVSVNKKDSSFEVLFIDYGNKEVVNKDSIKILPKEMLELPIYGIPIKIANVDVVADSEVFLAPINVKKIKMDNGVNVVNIIIENLAGEEESSEKVSNLNSTAEKSLTQTTSSELNSVCIEKLSKRITFDMCKSVPFNSGEQDIVIYSVDESGFVFCAPFSQENISANIEFPVQLTEHCTKKGITFDNDCKPEIGEMVLALYAEDNQWYRGVIIDKSSPMYDVNFVDFGNTERLDISKLCKMEEQFLGLEIQAHMCTLSGFTIRSDEDFDKVYEQVKSFTVFSRPEPLRAVVTVNENEITVNIPVITSWLLEKQLVRA